MWQWVIFLTVIPVFANISPGYEEEYQEMYDGISSEELYNSAFAYWSLDTLETTANQSLNTGVSGAGFCSIQGLDALNGAVVLEQADVANRKSAKITMSAYPNDCPSDPWTCTEGFTVAFWLSLKEGDNQTLSGDEACMLLSLNETSKGGFQIQLSGPDNIVSFRTLDITAESAEAYNATNRWVWNHLGMTWNNLTGELTVFSNGNVTSKIQRGQDNGFVPNAEGCTYLALDEIGIWDRPLNETEMRALRLDPFNMTDMTTPAPSLSPSPTPGSTPGSTHGPTTNDYSTKSAETTVYVTTPHIISKEVPAETTSLSTTTEESIWSTSPATSEHVTTTDDSTTGLETTPKPETSSDQMTDGVETTHPLDMPDTLQDVVNGINQSNTIDVMINNLKYVDDFFTTHNDSEIDKEVVLEILEVTGDKVDELVEGSTPEKRRSVLEIYLGIVNQILEINKKSTDWDGGKAESFIKGDVLGQAVDTMVSAYMRTGENSEVPQMINNAFIDSKLDVLPPGEETIEIKLGTGAAENDKQDVVVVIPRSIFENGQVGRVAVVSYYQGVQEHLPRKLQSKMQNYTVYSSLVGINIGSNSTTNFKDNVAITLSHLQIEEEDEPTCAFLKESIWSSEGCTTFADNRTSTKCECNHLTNFAVLVSPRPIIISEGDRIALDILTNLGLAISIICLVLTLIILNVLRQLTSTRISILKHTAAALLIAQSLFIIGGTVGHLSTLCKVVAALMHYSFLAVFCWLLIQGVQLYMKVRRALKGGIDLIYFCLFGWGFPLIVVAISFGVEHAHYGEDEICWISVTAGVGVLIAFIGPAYFVLAINLVVVCMVMHVFMTVKVNKDKSEMDKIKSGMKAVIVMVPILGLTWLFGLLIITSPEVAFQYLFVIFNCSQGVFIFLFHVVFNDEVKQATNNKRNKIAASQDSNTLFSKMMKSSKSGVDHSTSHDTTTSVQ